MHPLGWLFKYFFASIVGAATVVQAIKIARLELRDSVEGIIFRDRVHPDKHKRNDE